MAKRKKKQPTVSETLRDALKAWPDSLYVVSKATGIDHRALSRFRDGTHVTTATADTLAAFLGLVLVQQKDAKGK